MPPTPLALLALSFVLGVRHALDADHLAAVVTGVERGLRGGAALVSVVIGVAMAWEIGVLGALGL